MNHYELVEQIKNLCRFYWNCKFAASYNNLGSTQGTVNFSGRFIIDSYDIFSELTNINNANRAIGEFSEKYLQSLILLQSISMLESRISSYLSSQGKDSKGTLGQLQTRLQEIIPIENEFITSFDEVRELRNSMIHHQSTLTIKLQDSLLAGGNRIKIESGLSIGDRIEITSTILESALNILILYSSKF